MDSLSTEVLHNVFTQIKLEERIPCTLVCRKWWRVLDGYSLFYRVDIFRNEELLMRLLEMMSRFPHRATQVEEFDVFGSFPAGFDKRIVLSAFPNLRVLETKDECYLRNAVSPFNEPIEITQLKSKIQVLHDCSYCEVTSQLIASNLGAKLQQLELYFNLVGAVSAPPILSQLKNLPVLSMLKLNNLPLGINDLEIIHNNVPSIRVFLLDYITITASIMPVNVSPVTCITTFSIEIYRAASVDMHAQIYQYMARKYYKVDNIEFYDYMIDEYKPNNCRRVYFNGMRGFYKVVAPKKTKFHFRSVPPDLNVFDVFDEINCQLEDIRVHKCNGDMLQYLYQSNQSRYIQKLVLEWSDISSIHCISTMAALKTLKVLHCESGISTASKLTNCLNSCPATLKTLIFSETHVIPEISSVHLNYIETLEITCNDINSDLATVISTSFPNLINLKLTGEIKGKICITLPNLSFQKAEFHLTHFRSYGITFKIPNKMASQHYIVTATDYHLVEYEKIHHLPILNVISLLRKDWILHLNIRGSPSTAQFWKYRDKLISLFPVFFF